MTSNAHHRKHWFKLIFKAIQYSIFQSYPTSELITKSYDNLSKGYDAIWTNHMRDKTLELLDHIPIIKGEKVLDLTCGTGFITQHLATHTKTKVIGVDASNGMLSIAQKNYGDSCDFYQQDVLDYLNHTPPKTYDIITSGWALGYSKPYQVIRNAYRCLKTNGRFAVIDNSLFTIREPIWCTILTAAEDPSLFRSMFNVRFLPTLGALTRRMKFAGFSIQHAGHGSKTHYVPDGKQALRRLCNTGAFAGLERCIYPNRWNEFSERFIEIIEEKYTTTKGIPITHRYIAAIGIK